MNELTNRQISHRETRLGHLIRAVRYRMPEYEIILDDRDLIKELCKLNDKDLNEISGNVGLKTIEYMRMKNGN